MGDASPTERQLAAARVLSTFPPDDLFAAARSSPKPDTGGSGFRTPNAVTALSRLPPAVAWRLLMLAAMRRIGTLSELRPPTVEFDFDKARLWQVILWHNVIGFAERAGDLPGDVAQVAHRLVGEEPWTGTLDDLLTAARGVIPC